MNWKLVPEALKRFNAIGSSRGINWTWALFATEADAKAFDQWCSENGLETRGVYPPHNDREAWGVRYR